MLRLQQLLSCGRCSKTDWKEIDMLEHWIWLTTRKGIGTYGRASLIRDFETAERIYDASESELRDSGINKRDILDTLMDKSLDEAYDILMECKVKGIEILTYADEIYPQRLREIPDPPMVLYYKGVFPAVDHEAVIGIVGTRRSTLYGLLYAKEFGKAIACGGAVVVSGGARGIDSMALKGALEGQTPVICVLGSGLDVIYPRENADLFFEIQKHGCLISEFRPGTKGFGHNFPIRNRIISGLSLGVLVVEAPERSGALNTAHHALEQGRDVFAIPGNIGTQSSAGSNRLLREGAIMVESGWDVLSEYLSLFPGKLFDPKKADTMNAIISSRYSYTLPVYTPVIENPFRQKRIDNPEKKTYSDEIVKPASLSDNEEKVYSFVSEQSIHADQLVAQCGLPVSQVTAALTTLQIKGLICKLPGNYIQKK